MMMQSYKVSFLTRTIVIVTSSEEIRVDLNLSNCPRSVKEIAYTTLVRPKLEYGCEAWDPHFNKDISSLNVCRGKQPVSV